MSLDIDASPLSFGDEPLGFGDKPLNSIDESLSLRNEPLDFDVGRHSPDTTSTDATFTTISTKARSLSLETR
jgi:hypothetical protein